MLARVYRVAAERTAATARPGITSAEPNKSFGVALEVGRLIELSLGLCLAAALVSLFPSSSIAAGQLPSPPAAAAGEAPLASPANKATSIQQKAKVFEEILRDIDEGFVEPVDLDRLAETGFNAMLTSLDPYTEFENPAASKELRTQTAGNYGGVGLVIGRVTNGPSVTDFDPYPHVIKAFEGFAFDDGMRVGDKILAVDGRDMSGVDAPAVGDLLKGPPGTSVTLTYLRPGRPAPQSATLQRRAVLLRDVPLGLRLGDPADGVGYVRLSGFSGLASQELYYVLDRLQAQDPPLRALVLDLRGNPGGLLTTAIRVADMFLPEGLDVVTTRGRAAPPPQGPADSASAAAAAAGEEARRGTAPPAEGLYAVADAGGGGGGEVAQAKEAAAAAAGKRRGPGGATGFKSTYKVEPLVVPRGQGETWTVHFPLVRAGTRVAVLVDGGTASAAEIVAGALQDHDRAVIIGETTYGKGLVQQIQKLSGGTLIKYTVGKYYTPSGRCIQSKVYKNAGPGGPGGPAQATEVKAADRRVFYTDGGRPVRDGGGIEPDVATPEARQSQLSRELARHDAFFRFAAVWAGEHGANGEELARGDSPIVNDEVYSRFQAWVRREVPRLDEPFQQSLDIIKDALVQTGYGDAVKEVSALRGRLQELLANEYKSDEVGMRRLLERSIRERYLPESQVLALGLPADAQVQEAVRLLKDQSRYASIVAPPKLGRPALAAAPAALTQP